jgi:DNA-binding NarL/FixJ family response regulator
VLRPRVFLADDHPELLNALTTLLRPHFDLVGTASDGASLVSEAQRLNPDVIVVDITMPVMTGIDAVHKLVQSGSAAKFVFLTVHTGEEFLKACLSEGALGFVAKPHMKGHLIPAIQAALQGQTYIFLSGTRLRDEVT